MIKELVANHTGKVVDKWSSYLDVYDSILQPYRDKPINILEIGVANGGSLDVWSEYFPNAEHIVGCDINPECGNLTYSDDRISIVVGNANESPTLESIKEICSRYDIIIDDGSHVNPDIIKTFSFYYPLLSSAGVYIVEDLHTSYWDGWGGGLHSPMSAMAFFKRLADIPNYEHWRISRTRKNYLRFYEQLLDISFNESSLSTINSIMFTNSMVVVYPKAVPQNKLGKRLVRGDDEHVLPEMICVDDTDISILIADAVDDWHYDPFAMIQRINQLGALNDNSV